MTRLPKNIGTSKSTLQITPPLQSFITQTRLLLHVVLQRFSRFIRLNYKRFRFISIYSLWAYGTNEGETGFSACETGHELSELSDTGCRSFHKPSFIRKRGATSLPQDLLMNEALSSPHRSALVCVCVCVCADTLHIWLHVSLTLAALSWISHLTSLIWSQTQTHCNNSNSESLPLGFCRSYLAHKHIQKYSSSCQINKRGQPWNAELFTLNSENEIPSQSRVFSRTFLWEPQTDSLQLRVSKNPCWSRQWVLALGEVD